MEQLVPSLLDRLTDDEPGVSTEARWHHSISIEQLKDLVRRDLEALLNTRHSRIDLTDPIGKGGRREKVTHLAISSLTFGVPDFTASGVAGQEDRERVRRNVEFAIKRFEGRLRDTRVVLIERESEHDMTIRLTIHSKLNLDPTPEPISFDTVVHTNQGSCSIEATGS